MTDAAQDQAASEDGGQQTGQGESQEGLDVLLPGREVPLERGETVRVQPLKFMQLPAGARHIDGVIRAALRSGAITDGGEINISNLAGMYAEAGEHVHELILLCTYRDQVDGQLIDRNWLSAASIEEGLTLTAAVIEVNWRASLIKKLEALSGEMENLGQTILDRLGTPGSASSTG